MANDKERDFLLFISVVINRVKYIGVNIKSIACAVKGRDRKIIRFTRKTVEVSLLTNKIMPLM